MFIHEVLSSRPVAIKIAVGRCEILAEVPDKEDEVVSLQVAKVVFGFLFDRACRGWRVGGNLCAACVGSHRVGNPYQSAQLPCVATRKLCLCSQAMHVTDVGAAFLGALLYLRQRLCSPTDRAPRARSVAADAGGSFNWALEAFRHHVCWRVRGRGAVCH